MIKVIKDKSKANALTHGGTFHADEIFATIILDKLEDITLVRTLDVTEDDRKNIKYIYDIGFGEFDHHQKGGNGERADGTPYASCGLIWKKYGKSVLKKLGVTNIEDAFRLMDKNLFEFVDAIDNGYAPTYKTPYNYLSLSSVIGNFNPKWNEEVDADVKFMEALSFASKVFDNTFLDVRSKIAAKKSVLKAIDEAHGGYMILEKAMPWEDVLLNSSKGSSIDYVIHPSNRGGYAIRAVPISSGSFDDRKPFPKSWGGKSAKNLQKITGIATFKFCHINLFLCTSDTLDDAIKIAKLAERGVH